MMLLFPWLLHIAVRTVRLPRQSYSESPLGFVAGRELGELSTTSSTTAPDGGAATTTGGGGRGGSGAGGGGGGGAGGGGAGGGGAGGGGAGGAAGAAGVATAGITRSDDLRGVEAALAGAIAYCGNEIDSPNTERCSIARD
jgi:hypothetical protein